MNINGHNVTVFKIKNRRGYAAIACDHVTEGATAQQALARIAKALKRTSRKGKK